MMTSILLTAAASGSVPGGKALWIAFIVILVLLVAATVFYMLHNRRRLQEEADERERLALALEQTKKRQKAAEQKLTEVKALQVQTVKELTDAKTELEQKTVELKLIEPDADAVEEKRESEKKQSFLATTAVLVGGDYELVSVIDLENDSFEVLGAERSGELSQGKISYTEASRSFALESCVQADREKVLLLTSLQGLREQLKEREFFELTCDVLESGQPKRKIMRFTRYNESGTLLLATRRDVTEMLEREVRQKSALTSALLDAENASAERSELLSSVSRSVGRRVGDMLIVSAAAESEAESEETKAAFRAIKESGSAMVGVLSDLLDVLELEAGKRSASPEGIVTASFMADVRVRARAAAEAKSLKYSMKTGGAAPKRLSLDAHRAERIITCALGYAVSLAGDGSELNHTVTYSAPANGRVFLRQSISFSGRLPEGDEMSRAFAPFSGEDGLDGESLFIAKHLAEALGGGVELEPSKDGAVITIILPATPLT